MMIRSIEISDAEAFVTLNQKLAQETEFLLMSPEEIVLSVQQQEEKLNAMKSNENRIVFVAEVEENLIGFLGTTIFYPQKMKHAAHFAMAVLSSKKKMGVGTALLHAAEDWLKEKKVCRLEMTVMAHNIPAISFYKKNGFSQEGVRRNAIAMNDQFYDELYMAKFL